MSRKNRFKIKRTLADLFLLYSTGFVLFAVLLIGFLYITLEIRDFNIEAEKSREQFMNEQKLRIRNETEKVIEYIDFTRMFLEENMKRDIHNRVYEAYHLMESIYNQNIDNHSEDEIKSLIKDALRPSRFFNGRGYYFIVSLTGVEELYPVAPEFEGKNLLYLQDDKGNFVIQDELKVVKESGEGFVTDYWQKPDSNSDSLYSKTSFVKLFEPLNWYVGCGEYLDNVDRDIQADIIQRVKNIRFGKDGYIFINTFSKHAVVIDSPIYKSGDYLGDVIHENGMNHMHNQLEKALSEGGGFLEYDWPALGKTEPERKISFVKSYDDWEWIIGAGIQLNTIDARIEEQRKHLYEQVRLKIFLSILFVIIVLVLVFVIANRISKKVRLNFQTLFDGLENAIQTGEPLKQDDFTLQDIILVNDRINEVILTKFEAEALLKENELRFRTIFENVPVMIAVLDKNRIMKFWNRRGRENFQFNLKEQFSIEQILPLLEDTEENIEEFRKFVNYDGIFREMNLILNGKKVVHNWATFKTQSDEIILVGYDITLMKENQQMLKELNETKDKFFRIISHDLQAPFNAIIGFSDVLITEENSLSMQERMEIFGLIHDSALSMHRLLLNLLHWARSQSGQILVNKEDFDVHNLVKDIESFCSIQCNKKMIKFSNTVPEDCIIHTDRSMLETVIRNLASNAIKFSSAGGNVEVGCISSDDAFTLFVKDDGMGIPESQMENLFKLSSEKQRAGTANEAGTGLGLIICYDFIHRLNGKIYVKSVVEQGTTFFIRLPKSHIL